MSRWRAILGVALGALSAVAGCSVGPDYHRPAALGTNAMPTAYSSGRGSTNDVAWKPAEPSAHLPRGAWWELFNDPGLGRLETLATNANQTLAVAGAHWKEARALVDVARAGYWPNVSATPALLRQRTSVNAFDSGRPKGESFTYNNFLVPLQATWELDLWGQVRRQSESAQALLQAASDDLESLRLAIQADVASDYFTWRALDAEAAVLRETVAAFETSLDLTRTRRVGGIATDLDVAQAETQLRNTEAQVPVVLRQREALEHALALLCGQAAPGFTVAPPIGPSTLWEVPGSVPSELLERRPDIAAAERRVAAANADVGVACAAFYPRVRLTGLAGFQSIDASTLFNAGSRVWAFGPSVELPIFTGGRNRAQLAAAQARFDSTVAEYRQTVLTAFREVEDQLSAQLRLAQQLESEQAALMAARRTVEIANNRYRSGLVTYLEVVTAQGSALALERTVTQLEGERHVITVALVKALGGTWPAR